jgi:hypothetical protein
LAFQVEPAPMNDPIRIVVEADKDKIHLLATFLTALQHAPSGAREPQHPIAV